MKGFGNLTVPALKNYKDENAWLRAVYRKNKDFIDERTGNYKNFKQAVRDYQEDQPELTIKQSLQKLSRSSHAGFQDRNELQQELFNEAMRGKKRKFKKETGETFNSSNLHYNSKTGEWAYTDKITGEIKAYFADIRKTGYRKGQARYRI